MYPSLWHVKTYIEEVHNPVMLPSLHVALFSAKWCLSDLRVLSLLAIWMLSLFRSASINNSHGPMRYNWSAFNIQLCHGTLYCAVWVAHGFHTPSLDVCYGNTFWYVTFSNFWYWYSALLSPLSRPTTVAALLRFPVPLTHFLRNWDSGTAGIASQLLPTGL